MHVFISRHRTWLSALQLVCSYNQTNSGITKRTLHRVSDIRTFNTLIYITWNFFFIFLLFSLKEERHLSSGLSFSVGLALAFNFRSHTEIRILFPLNCSDSGTSTREVWVWVAMPCVARLLLTIPDRHPKHNKNAKIIIIIHHILSKPHNYISVSKPKGWK